MQSPRKSLVKTPHKMKPHNPISFLYVDNTTNQLTRFWCFWRWSRKILLIIGRKNPNTKFLSNHVFLASNPFVQKLSKFSSRNINLWFLSRQLKFNVYNGSVKIGGNTAGRYTWLKLNTKAVTVHGKIENRVVVAWTDLCVYPCDEALVGIFSKYRSSVQ